MDNDWNDISELKERDINVLQIIDEENLTCFTFEGLRRRLKIHQETLSRILNRLIEEKILKKTNTHYALTSKAKDLLNTQNQTSDTRTLPLLQTFLPPEIPFDKIVSNLKGRWFGTLRWLGYYKTNEDVVLKWITTDGGIILSATFSKSELLIGAKMVSQNDLNAALTASYQLMSYITKLISKTEHN